jgi:hypothetical protein
MSYMLLIFEPSGQRDTRNLQQGQQLYQRMLDFSESLRANDVLVESNSLQREAVRLSVRAGKPSITDGPFTEAKVACLFPVGTGVKAPLSPYRRAVCVLLTG